MMTPAQALQNGTQQRLYDPVGSIAAFVATVQAVHSDRATCDIQTVDGVSLMYNVPVVMKAGMSDDQGIYGCLDLPQVDDVVVVLSWGVHENYRMIIGSLVPYLNNLFNGNTAPTHSTSKSYTTSLLEAGREKAYKRILPSGTTVEVKEDGSVYIETPSGQTIIVDEAASSVKINGNLEVDK